MCASMCVACTLDLRFIAKEFLGKKKNTTLQLYDTLKFLATAPLALTARFNNSRALAHSPTLQLKKDDFFLLLFFFF